jgi:hypothetical protein
MSIFQLKYSFKYLVLKISKDVLSYDSQVSSRITRQSVNNLLFVPKDKTDYYRRSFVLSSCNLCVKMWNVSRGKFY